MAKINHLKLEHHTSASRWECKSNARSVLVVSKHLPMNRGRPSQQGSWASGEQRIGDMARRSVEEQNNAKQAKLQDLTSQLHGVRLRQPRHQIASLTQNRRIKKICQLANISSP